MLEQHETLPIEVRRVTKADFNLETDVANFERNSLERFLSDSKNVLILAFSGEKIVGLLRGHILDRYDGKGAEMFLNEIDVSPAFQKKGIATKMVEQMKVIARDNSCSETWVLTNKSNTGAMKLYEATGYQPINTDDVMLNQKI